MEDGLLRYTARQRLLKLAAQMGIESFKANLVIAEVLHDAGYPRPAGRVVGNAAAQVDNSRMRYGLRLAIAMAIAASIAAAVATLITR